MYIDKEVTDTYSFNIPAKKVLDFQASLNLYK